MRKLMVATLLAGGAVAAPALAQDATPTFTGPRVEAILGYDHTGAGSSIDNDNGSDDQKIDGLLYGVGAGYDVNVGGAVVGVEGEFTDSTTKSSRPPVLVTAAGATATWLSGSIRSRSTT